jgi:hypothetical protein
MTDAALNQNLAFGTQLSVTGPFAGTAQQLGNLANAPVAMVINNYQCTVPIFVADNAGSTNGITLGAGQAIILDCRNQQGKAPNMAFPINTPIYLTATGGAASDKVYISFVYAF